MATLTVASSSVHPQSRSAVRRTAFRITRPRGTFARRALLMAPIHYTAAQVALMVRIANVDSDDFAKAVNLCNRRFASIWVENLVARTAKEDVAIPEPVLRFFDLRCDGKGGYVWKPL